MPPREAARIGAIDGLRGVAAFIVVLYHLHGAISRTASNWLWTPLDWVARNGYLGVDIFFVISGFVIALSVSRGAPTLRYFGRFIIRRSIRLDPPYWCAILLEMALMWLTVRFFASHAVTLPTVPQLLAHVTYLQELLGYGSIVDVFWTLTYEVQFYAFLVGLVVLHANLPARLRGPTYVWIALSALYVVSLWTRYWRPGGLPAGLAIDRWFQFFVGSLTWWALTRAGRTRPLYLAWAGLAIAVFAAREAPTQLLAIGVSGIIYQSVRNRWLGSLLSIAPLSFLGLISYSLYLYHGSVGWRYVSLIQDLLPGPWSPLVAISVYATGVLGSVLFSAALWWLVERPFLSLSRRVKLPLRPNHVDGILAP